MITIKEPVMIDREDVKNKIEQGVINGEICSIVDALDIIYTAPGYSVKTEDMKHE